MVGATRFVLLLAAVLALACGELTASSRCVHIDCGPVGLPCKRFPHAARRRRAAAAGASAAKCKANAAGCGKCSRDGSRCVSCWDTYGLTSSGKCVECKVRGEMGWTCTKCKGNDPSFCLKCEDYEGYQPTGVFATKGGRCKSCLDKSCNRCAAITGTCQECNR